MSVPENNVKLAIDNSVIKDVLQSEFTNSRTKINDDAVSMMAELSKLIVIETVQRAIHQAKQEKGTSSTTITLDHLEAIIPQLMMDLP